MERVTVIIPVYNSSQYLADCILSVHRQSYPIDEIIVIDDGSNDHPEAVIAKLPNHKIRFFRQSNSGPGSARNLGIRFAKGEYLAFLDADDMWEVTKIEEQIRYLEACQDAALIYCHKLWVDMTNTPIPVQPQQTYFPEGWIFSNLYNSNYISSCSCVVVRRNALDKVGGFNEAPVFRGTEDYELWLRISAKFPCLSIPLPLVRYRRHDRNITKHSVSRAKGILATLRNASDLLTQNQVDPRNLSSTINIHSRMHRVYEETIVSLFWASKYTAVRKIGWEGIMNGHYNSKLLCRLILSILPSPLIGKLRKINRVIKIEGTAV